MTDPKTAATAPSGRRRAAAWLAYLTFLAAVAYLVVTLPLSWYAKKLERRFAYET